MLSALDHSLAACLLSIFLRGPSRRQARGPKTNTNKRGQLRFYSMKSLCKIRSRRQTDKMGSAGSKKNTCTHSRSPFPSSALNSAHKTGPNSDSFPFLLCPGPPPQRPQFEPRVNTKSGCHSNETQRNRRVTSAQMHKCQPCPKWVSSCLASPTEQKGLSNGPTYCFQNDDKSAASSNYSFQFWSRTKITPLVALGAR